MQRMNPQDVASAARCRPAKTNFRAARRFLISSLLTLCFTMTSLPGNAQANATRTRPLIRDFVGLNTFAQGHSPHRAFDPELYRPACRMLREYHWVARDLGENPAELPPFPKSKDGLDWAEVYREWISKGWNVEVSLQFESVDRSKWKDFETEARNYARAYAREFGRSGARKLIDTVEIGNEPTKWSDEEFSRMFRAMAQGLREGDSRIRIVTSNVTAGPSGRWDKSVDLVAPHRELFDVLALHVYPELEQDPSWQRSYPENPKLLRYLNDVEALCRWRDRHAPEKEVWITEFGYDSSTKTAHPQSNYPNWKGVTDEQQAQWLVRSLLVFASMPVGRAYIYFFNDRNIPSLHASAGITRNFEPKPSFHALAHLQRVLGDFRFHRIVTDVPGKLRVQEFEHGENPDQLVWAVWSPTGERVTLRETLSRVPGRLVRAERMPLAANEPALPEGGAVQRSDGSVEADVTESPLYLVFERASSAGDGVAAGSSSTPMTARELNAWLRSLHPVPEPSVDRVIVGDPETVVRGIAVAWTPTWDALREAEAKGCNVFVAHEPTFFSHHDLDGFEQAADQISPAALKAMSGTRDAKRRWIEEHGMVVIRCHDVLDLIPGGVADALARKLGFAEADVVANEPYYRVVRVEPALRASELAQRMADAFGALGQPGVAFYGDADRVVHRLGLGTGFACEPWKFVEMGAEMCLTIDDRIKTWIETEWADDSGFPMVVIHHGTSEEWGVHRLREMIAEKFPDTNVQLLPQGFRTRWISPAAHAK